MKTLVKIFCKEKIDCRSLFSAEINIYGLRMFFYSRDPMLIRFVKRKFSLMKYCRLDRDRYNLSNNRIKAILSTKEIKPDDRELLFIDTDTNGLVAKELSDRCLFLHASCVASGKGYLLFLGPRMSGKSTISVCLRKRGFELLADDDAVLNYDLSRPIPFPTIGNFRGRGPFSLKFKGFDKSIYRYIYNMSEPEFKAIYDTELYLYRQIFKGRKKKKVTNFIFINGWIKGKPHLEAADKMDSETIKLFFRFIITGEEDRNRNISKIIDLYSKSYFYFLTMGTPEDTADLILKKFY